MHASNAPRVSAGARLMDRWRRLDDLNPNLNSLITTAILLIGLTFLFSLISDRFFSVRNLGIILNQSAPYIIIGVGMTLVITTRGIDLSVGAIVALSATVMAIMMVKMDFATWLVILAGIGVGALCGMFNGFWIAVYRVPPLIVTLGTMVVFRGIAYVVLEHQIVFGFNEGLLWFARARYFGLAPSVYIALATVLVGYLVLNQTRLGASITAVGGNPEAARLAGINVPRVQFIVYTLTGLLCGLATVVWLARLNSAQAALAYGVEFHAIALVVLGGTALFGGRGLMIGSLMGALILGVVENGLVVVGLPSFVQQVYLGLIFIAVVAFRAIQANGGIKLR